MKRISSRNEKDFDFEMKKFYFSKMQRKGNEKKIISYNPKDRCNLFGLVQLQYPILNLFPTGKSFHFSYPFKYISNDFSHESVIRCPY